MSFCVHPLHFLLCVCRYLMSGSPYMEIVLLRQFYFKIILFLNGKLKKIPKKISLMTERKR